LVDVRRLWPDVIAATQRKRRVTWIHLTQNSQVVGFDGLTLTLGFNNAGARGSFEGGSVDVLQEAIREVVGAEWQIETIVDPGAEAGVAPPPAAPELGLSTPPAAPASSTPMDVPEAVAPVDPEPPSPRRPRMAEIQAEAEDVHDPDAAVDRDDDVVDAESGADLLARELGAQVIEEIPHP
jgi:DNA polymerase-3 subunit gamma/tau